MTDHGILPEGLPDPADDGAAHLPGRRLTISDGGTLDLAALGPGRTRARSSTACGCRSPWSPIRASCSSGRWTSPPSRPPGTTASTDGSR